MEVYNIPIPDPQDLVSKYILYRPLTGLAFVGNRAMADLAVRLAGEVFAEKRIPTNLVTGKQKEAEDFLRRIGFFEPDPPQPVSGITEYLPTTAVLLMTTRCQLRCVYCYAAAGEHPAQDLPPELGRIAIDAVCLNASERGLSQFELTYHGGGEPTFNWKTLQSCTLYARQKPVRASISLTSNGIWSRPQCQWIIANLDYVSLSMDGSPKTQDGGRPFVSGRPSSPIVMKNIQQLDQRQFAYGIRLTSTAPWTNLPDEVRFICQETSCRSIQVEPAFNTLRGGHGKPGIEEAQAFIEGFMEAYDVARKAGCRFYYSGARLGLVTEVFCSAPMGALIVNANGDMVTCYEIADRQHALMSISIIGRIQDGVPVVDEKARSNLHRLMAERRASCRECFCYWSCAGDCYTRAFQDGPDGHLQHDRRCEINRELMRRLLLYHIAESGEGVFLTPRVVGIPQSLEMPGLG